MPNVTLKPGRAKPFRCRHPWVYSGGVRTVDEDARDGEPVDVLDDRGRWVARGLLNRRSQIVVRLLSWDPEEAIDDDLLARRIDAARSLREDLLSLPARTDAYRLIHGEGDGLPGVVVDRYGDALVVAISVLGMDQRKEVLLDILQDRFRPAGIFERGDPDVREKEGLAPVKDWARGGAAIEAVREDGLRWEVDVVHGQKTGLYLDQRDNRRAIEDYAAGRRVLDACTYTGGFALHAARAGSREVVAFDRSRYALAAAERNAEANGLPVRFFRGELFETLTEMRNGGQAFGLVVLDPPKFARRRGEVEGALDGYRELATLGADLTEPGGILVICSCTAQVSEDVFERTVNEGAAKAGRALTVLERRGQPPDHPVAAACPEGRYLKCFVCLVR